MTIDTLFGANKNVALAHAFSLLGIRRLTHGKRGWPAVGRYEAAAAYGVILRRSVADALRDTLEGLRAEAQHEFQAQAQVHADDPPEKWPRTARAAAQLWKLCDELLAKRHAQPLDDATVAMLIYFYAGMDEVMALGAKFDAGGKPRRASAHRRAIRSILQHKPRATAADVWRALKGKKSRQFKIDEGRWGDKKYIVSADGTRTGYARFQNIVSEEKAARRATRRK